MPPLSSTSSLAVMKKALIVGAIDEHNVISVILKRTSISPHTRLDCLCTNARVAEDHGMFMETKYGVGVLTQKFTVAIKRFR